MTDMPSVQNNGLVPKNPNFKSFVEEKLEGQHFMRHIGFELTTIEAGLIEGEAPLQTFMTQQDGLIHGGVVSTVADIVTGFAAFSLVEKDQRVVSANLDLSFYRPGTGQKVKARGWVNKPGSRLHFCEGIIWTEDEDGTYTNVAGVNSIMAVFRPGKRNE